MMENSRLTLLLMLILVFSKTPLIGQIQKSPAFSFCDKKGETIELKELKKCQKLTVSNKKVEIKSYLVAIPVKMDQDNIADITQLDKEVMYHRI